MSCQNTGSASRIRQTFKASDRVQSKRPIETPGFLISHILIARLAFWGYLFTIRDFFPGQN